MGQRSERLVMLNLKRDVYSLPALPSQSPRDFPLPVLVWVEISPGEWSQLTIPGPIAALQAMDNVLSSSTDADWHRVVGRLADAVHDPRPDALERARHALAVYAARLGILAG
jgi:hypothetical protein